MAEFVDTLKDIRNGSLLTELPQALSDVLAAVRATGKGGTLTLTLSIKPLEGSANSILISDDVKTKLPQPTRQTTVMFVTDKNELTRRDPRQPPLPMAVVRPISAERVENQ